MYLYMYYMYTCVYETLDESVWRNNDASIAMPSVVHSVASM